MILCDVGEVGIHADDKTYLLRPSFYAMSRLGKPETVVSIFALVYDESADIIAQFLPDKLAETISFRAAIDVLRNCWASEPRDRDWVVGRFSEGKFLPGIVPLEHIFPLARCLLKHGLLGDMAVEAEKTKAEQEEKKDGDFTPTFTARDHVAFAMAHLGIAERDAWQMTMTSLLLALRAKFPREATTDAEKKAEGAVITAKEHDQTMEWLEKINRKRQKRGKKPNV